MKENILMVCAHSDDLETGAGGTILKYLKEGKKIIKITLSGGELSHPHLREKVVKKIRAVEAERLAKKLKIKTIHFNLKDGRLKQEVEKRSIKEKLKKIIEQYNPKKIFVPSALDPHMDHRAVNTLVLNVVNKLKKKYDVYAYEVWNIVDEQRPVMYENITPYFKKKLEMMKAFKSQKHFIYPLMLPVYLRARRYGRKANCKYAEKFYKLK